MGQTVILNRQGNTALIEIDNPPVNALSQSVRAGLIEALDQAEADPAIEMIALLGKGKVFIAGADIKEFGKPPQSPILPDVISRLENSPKPVIAILHGVALGGGLEVALGCHYRVAFNDIRLGLPEVKLGLLPGAGGTQRLPRLTGLATAAEWITKGIAVDAATALAEGLIDEVTDAESGEAVATAITRRWKSDDLRLRKTGELPNPASNAPALEAIRQQLEKQHPNLYSPYRILEALQASCTLPLVEGLRFERDLFFQCMDSPQRAGLIHHFFASKAIGKVPGGEAEIKLIRLVLSGEHSIFNALAHHPLALRSSSSNPGIEVHIRKAADAKEPTTVVVKVVNANTDLTDTTEAFTLLSIPDSSMLELIDHHQQPEVQQALMNVLKTGGFTVIPSKERSLYDTLCASQVNADNPRKALENAALSAAEAGLCYRPADIDVLAIETLAYPQHLGGPHYQATLSK
ncbi:enoyl-CoA hydratase/isomerase family protein [Saccharospirillum sp.]|uniref:enoyl-CoA hydratase/isomerase family protein n=1 Tax=Saccharospirillum sp. TaxID=2033801 RepID=UPI0034A01D08